MNPLKSGKRTGFPVFRIMDDIRTNPDHNLEKYGGKSGKIRNRIAPKSAVLGLMGRLNVRTKPWKGYSIKSW